MAKRRLAVILAVEPGKEKRVRQDILDALYPYDQSVAAETLKGAVAVYSLLEKDEIFSILRRYPIRGVLAVKEVICTVKLQDLNKALANILRCLEHAGLTTLRIEIRTRGTAHAQALKRELEGVLRRLSMQRGKGGKKVHIEVVKDLLALCIVSKPPWPSAR